MYQGWFLYSCYSTCFFTFSVVPNPLEHSNPHAMRPLVGLTVVEWPRIKASLSTLLSLQLVHAGVSWHQACASAGKPYSGVCAVAKEPACTSACLCLEHAPQARKGEPSLTPSTRLNTHHCYAQIDNKYQRQVVPFLSIDGSPNKLGADYTTLCKSSNQQRHH